MKHNLLLAMAVSATASVWATGPAAFQPVSMTDNAHTTIVKVAKPTKGTPDKPVKSIRRTGVNTTVNPLVKQNRASRISASASAGLRESFEGWDGTTSAWIPEGWTVESNSIEGLSENQKWNVWSPASSQYPSPTDGKCYLSIFVAGSNKPQDETIISPVFTIQEGMQLTFDLYTLTPYYYNWDYYNAEEMTFSKFEPVGDVCVLIREEGAQEWTQIYSLTEANTGKTALEMTCSTSGMLEQISVSLAGYAGKNVQIAFRYYGTDCDTLFIDNIFADFPPMPLEPYLEPFETQFFGFNKSASWSVAGVPVAIYPVYTDLVWQNYTYVPEATYLWSYYDQENSSTATSDDPDMLTLNYKPNFSTLSTTINNFITPPSLRGMAPGYRETVFECAHPLMQLGGKAEVTFNDGTTDVYGILPFDPMVSGLTQALTEEDAGTAGIPVFGHGEGVDDFWTKYTFDEPATETEFVTLDAIMNFIYPSASPLVVHGAHMLAMGKVTEEAEIKFEILGLTEDYDISVAPVITSAVCKGTDIITFEFGSTDYLTVCAEFDTPIALDNSYAAYVIRISGFRGAGIQRFSPMLSEFPHPYLCHGWIEKTITHESMPRKSWSSVATIQGEYGDLMSAFAINLDGEYPYLHSDVDKITVAEGVVTVPMQSYYDGSELTVEVPNGISAKITGRYGDTELKVNATTPEAITSEKITVTGPGVKKVFELTKLAGVAAPDADYADAVPVSYFTPDGRAIDPAEATGGIFIVKYSDGSVRKLNR